LLLHFLNKFVILNKFVARLPPSVLPTKKNKFTTARRSKKTSTGAKNRKVPLEPKTGKLGQIVDVTMRSTGKLGHGLMHNKK
jgi:hypothetical protein